MNARDLGLLLAAVGVVAIIVGLLVAAGAFRWFGQLPGDIRIEGERTRIFVPITSMLLLSVAFSLLLSFIRRFF
jgi:hypothetical protein